MEANASPDMRKEAAADSRFLVLCFMSKIWSAERLRRNKDVLRFLVVMFDLKVVEGPSLSSGASTIDDDVVVVAVVRGIRGGKPAP